MIYDRKSKSYRRFLRPLTPDEIVQASLWHKCQYWHADMQKLVKRIAVRKRSKKEQWSTWEVDKAQLYMDMYDMRQHRTASTLSTNSQIEQEDKLAEPSEPVQGQIAAEGDFLRWSIKDKKRMLAEAKTAIREHLTNQILNHPGQSSSRWAPPEWLEVWSEDFETG